MALDLAITHSVAEGKAPPTLRIYGWNPAAISLGYHQSRVDIDMERCKKDAIDVVVRPTGGRAVLHAEELTYSVVLPDTSEYYQKSIVKMYETISRCLVSALQMLDINVSLERTARASAGTPRDELTSMCYASSIQYEIGFNGKKLVGSAQRRFDGALLQHGSILIGRKHLDIVDYLAGLTEEKRRTMKHYLHKHTVCLNDLAKKDIKYKDVAAVIRQGFKNQLGVNLITGQPVKREK